MIFQGKVLFKESEYQSEHTEKHIGVPVRAWEMSPGYSGLEEGELLKEKKEPQFRLNSAGYVKQPITGPNKFTPTQKKDIRYQYFGAPHPNLLINGPIYSPCPENSRASKGLNLPPAAERSLASLTKKNAIPSPQKGKPCKAIHFGEHITQKP